MISQKKMEKRFNKSLMKHLNEIDKIKGNPDLLNKYLQEHQDNLICRNLKIDTEMEEIRLHNRLKKETKGDKKLALSLSKNLNSAATSVEELNRINLYNNPKFKEFAEQKSFECTICFCEEEVTKMVMMPKCNHYYCLNCMQTYLATNIKERKLDLKCPSDECKKKMSYNDIKMIAAPEIFELYERYLLENTLGKDKKCKFCPKAGCGMAMYSMGDNPLLVCPKCHLKFCFNCNTDQWHTGVTCKKFQKWLKENGGGDSSFEEFISKRCKKCPRCDVNIQKNGGCDHMNCTNCGHHFQWSRGTEIRGANENANYPNVMIRRPK
jgi:hypothetical protein